MAQPELELAHVETVFLDMDGTLLDLAFDNYFWHELVPRCLGRQFPDLDPNAARTQLSRMYESKQGTLDWYCVEHWTEALGLDIMRLKVASSQRIAWLPGARAFLQALSSRGLRLVMLTNAHEHTLGLKRDVIGLGHYFERCISSHELGFPKEHPRFWQRLSDELHFEPARTLFVDDSLPVLDAAAAFGIGEVIAISRPDSRQPQRTIDGHRAVPGVTALLAGWSND